MQTNRRNFFGILAGILSLPFLKSQAPAAQKLEKLETPAVLSARAMGGVFLCDKATGVLIDKYTGERHNVLLSNVAIHYHQDRHWNETLEEWVYGRPQGQFSASKIVTKKGVDLHQIFHLKLIPDDAPGYLAKVEDLVFLEYTSLEVGNNWVHEPISSRFVNLDLSQTTS